MSETDDNLGPMPESTAEEPQLAPGGTDAVEVESSEERADSEARDLDPERNPAVEEVLPDEVAADDSDKEQAPAEGQDDEAGGSVTGDAQGQPEESGEVEAGDDSDAGATD
jgi:hypothetical protein